MILPPPSLCETCHNNNYLQIYKPYAKKMSPNVTEMATKNIGFSFILTRKSSKFIYIYYIPWYYLLK